MYVVRKPDQLVHYSPKFHSVWVEQHIALSPFIDLLFISFKFLDDCTKKLNLESGARLLFDWAGNEVNSFSEGTHL